MAVLIASTAVSRIQANAQWNLFQRRREALAELERNGVRVSPKWANQVAAAKPAVAFEPIPELPALNVTDYGTDDFVSAPDAVDMRPEDIANVVAVSAVEVIDTLAAIAAKLTRKQCLSTWAEWSRGTPDWADDDVRWGLTPHALKQLERVSK
jgi:hypothetical protein